MSYLVLALCGLLGSGLAFPSGAPSSSCLNMLPDHYYRGRDVLPQTNSPPYRIVIDTESNVYRPGQVLEVEIESSPGRRTEFRGFILEARAVSGGTRGAVGRWIIDDDDDNAWQKKTICQSDSALTHRRSRTVYSVEGSWIAPATPVGDIVFVASVVRNYQIFWVNITSPILRPYRPESAGLVSAANVSGSCAGPVLEELPDDRPGVAILCYEDKHCPCGWVCCPQCGSLSLCRKPRGSESAEDD